MTKRELATKLYFELKEKHDIQNIANSIKSSKINDRTLSVDEQLDLANLIRTIHAEKTRGYFEDVSAFLTLVKQVETQIKAQSNSQSGGGSNTNK